MVDDTDDGQDGRGEKSNQAFRTISEVAAELDVAQHVLRFWETKFPQISPLKRGGGRRYYRPEDVALLTQVRDLLYREGYTIKGVQKLLRDQRRRQSGSAPQSGSAAQSGGSARASATAERGSAARGGTAAGSDGRSVSDLPPAVQAELKAIVRDLKDLRTLIDRALR